MADAVETPRVISVASAPAKRKRADPQTLHDAGDAGDERSIDFTALNLYSVHTLLKIVGKRDLAMECIMQLRDETVRLEQELKRRSAE